MAASQNTPITAKAETNTSKIGTLRPTPTLPVEPQVLFDNKLKAYQTFDKLVKNLGAYRMTLENLKGFEIDKNSLNNSCEMRISDAKRNSFQTSNVLAIKETVEFLKALLVKKINETEAAIRAFEVSPI